ncbi:hypothetical protein C7460_10919 [Marinoscillum furvescens DSM 4134]|uniref:Uncharacterized protein n=1 Tax=Marinoscillum furvescens DSM 4134 TaxID=1122208 RepID=A0A3D9L4F1_MARFU|nr:hypothetical protein C7460_10919 [Marinoscillum furvescens DSM 4134]
MRNFAFYFVDKQPELHLLGYHTMDDQKKEKLEKRLKEMKEKALQEEEGKNKNEKLSEVPRDAFRKNLGCGG